MNDFFTGLQFLTRIQIVRQSEWSAESFGRSVRYFPLIGAVIGAILASGYYVAAPYLPVHVLAALLVIAEIALTGGLHCDGLMDTADGLFSGRSRERMLEIMKDSRVGANGVAAFGMALLLKWSLYLDLPPALMPAALFISPITGRFAMTVAITAFPYARPEGIGKAFAQYAGKTVMVFAALTALLLIIPFGKMAVAALFAVTVFTICFGGYVTGVLGGLTGDIYGAITEVSEILALAFMLILKEWR